MTDERRGAVRFRVPEKVDASIGGVPVRIVDLSAIGARVAHRERFPLNAPQLRIVWDGATVSIPLRVARSEIVGREGSALLYETGIQFVGQDMSADAVIAAILRHGEAPPPTEAAPRREPAPSLDDSWTRQVRFLQEEPEDAMPYAQFRLTPSGWQKEYVPSPEQPEDGFTIPRDALDFHELQKTFEQADPETRRMMRIALESQLAAK